MIALTNEEVKKVLEVWDKDISNNDMIDMLICKAGFNTHDFLRMFCSAFPETQERAVLLWMMNEYELLDDEDCEIASISFMIPKEENSNRT